MREGRRRRRGLARSGARVVIAALLAGVMHTAAPVSTRATAEPVEALLIGDSVLGSLTQSYGIDGREALAGRHSFIIDAAGCRRLITTSCRIAPSPAPSDALTALRARAGQYHRALVVAAGYNDVSTGPSGIAAAVDAVIAEARKQGIDHVVWLTYREAGPAGDVSRYRQSNAILRSRDDPELVIADWASLSATLPQGWFSGDGIHLGRQAATAIAELIGDTLDRLPPPPPPPPPLIRHGISMPAAGKGYIAPG